MTRVHNRTFPRGLMFHRFRDPGDSPDFQGALTAAQLEAIVLGIGIANIRSPEEWLEGLRTGSLVDEDVCITFDDALLCQFDVALPILEKHGLAAFWFVYSCVFDGIPVRSEAYSYVAGRTGGMEALITEFLSRLPPTAAAQLASVDFEAYASRMRETAPYYSARDIAYRFLRNRPSNARWFEPLMDDLVADRGFDMRTIARNLWLTNEHLVALAATGHEIGLHSYDHPYEIAKLRVEDQRSQYRRNMDHIKRVTGRTPVSVAHPLNSYGDDTLAVLGALDIRCGFRANVLAPEGKRVNASHLELARDDSSDLVAATCMPGQSCRPVAGIRI